MQEAEVSLRVALYYIKSRKTNEDVTVSIDGAHIKTGDKEHFDIWSFLNENGCIKIDGDNSRWQGLYQVSDYPAHIKITSQSGIGDVNVRLLDGKTLYVESKKGKENNSSLEYPLMREAIGQLMTAPEFTDDMIPAVAVPYSEKTDELAREWIGRPLMKQTKIRFLLVKEDGDIVTIGWSLM